MFSNNLTGKHGKVVDMSDQDEYQKNWQSFFDVIVNTVNDAVTGIDKDGTVRLWNHAAEELYSIPRQDIIGRKIGEFFPHGSLMLYQVMETGVAVHKVYHRPRSDKHVFINAVPVLDAAGALIGAVSIEQDITHIVKLSEGRYHAAQQSIGDSYIPPLETGSLSVSQMVELASRKTLGSLVYPFLIVGETGVGKRALAELIHNLSGMKGDFVPVPCHLIPSGLIDLELFGYEGGVLGASNEVKRGKLELAENGTLLLISLHTLPLSAQSRLTQALESGEFTRIGGSTPIPLKCQIIASITPDGDSIVEQSIIYQDLYYQFHVATILPLRKRKQDLPDLCHYFLQQAAARNDRRAPRLSQEALAVLNTYEWPGNIPQLRNVMEHIVMVSHGDEATLDDLPASLRPTRLEDFHAPLPLNALAKDVEKTTILEALQRSQGNKASAARILGISRGALYYKLQRYGIK